jgi:peptide/nickel transport system ATP-binding protein
MCLARTLATEPEVLLMDEPTSALDPQARHRLEATAHRLVADGRPMVWVTHDLDQADRLADHRRVIVAGRLATEVEMRRYLASAVADDGAAREGGPRAEEGAGGVDPSADAPGATAGAPEDPV